MSLKTSTAAKQPQSRIQRTPHNSISIPANYPSILTSLRSLNFPIIAPPAPLSVALTPLISSLKLHPILEAALHIRNMDLTTAHTLLQDAHALDSLQKSMLLEAMVCHLEGNMDKARECYKKAYEVELKIDIVEQGETLLCCVWGRAGDGKDLSNPDDATVVRKELLEKATNRALGFVTMLQDFRQSQSDHMGEEMELSESASREWERTLMRCENRFGTGQWVDANVDFMHSGAQVRRAGEAMVMVGQK